MPLVALVGGLFYIREASDKYTIIIGTKLSVNLRRFLCWLDEF